MDSKSMMIYEGIDFGLRLEYTKDEAFIHLPYISKLTKAIVIKLQDKVIEVLDFLLDLGYNRLWAVMESSNSTIRNLTTLIGFDYVADENGYSVFKLEAQCNSYQ